MTLPLIGRRRFLITTPAVIAAAKLVGCTGDVSTSSSAKAMPRRLEDDLVSSVGAAASSDLECPATPLAYVLGSLVETLQAALVEAGFDVVQLPLDRSPIDLRGLILIPAFASEDAAYAPYMKAYAADLYAFVDNANVLVQLAQASETEASPPFLPTTHTAKRTTGTSTTALVRNMAHSLLDGVEIESGRLAVEASTLAVDPFASQDGFEVVLSDETTRLALLMEGAYGQGRIVLSALSLELTGDAKADAFVTAFSRNLARHVADVCMRTTDAVEVTSSRVSEAFAAGSQMLAVMPDTQVYAMRLPGVLTAQTAWIRANAQALDIRYALQLGDMTNNNTRTEWERAKTAFELLHGGVPYAIAPGNHDYGPSGDASNRETLFNEYFPFAKHAEVEGFGGAYEQGALDSTYHLFEIGGRRIVLLALEWAPRDEVVAWANDVMLEHSDREGILITHAYLNNNDRRYDHTDTEHSQRFNPHQYRTPGSKNDGEQLWQKLVRRHRFIMTINGHVLGDGVGYLASRTDAGTTCQQILANYQMRTLGGEGYMRLLEFQRDGRTVVVHTYSPLYDKFLDEPGQNFQLVLG